MSNPTAVVSVDTDRRIKWFKLKETDEVNPVTIRPAHEIVDTGGQFKAHIRQFFKSKEQNIQFATTKEELREQLKGLDVDQLSHQINHTLPEAKRVNSFYEYQRNRGSKTGRRKVQNFFRSFSDFLGAYSGIVEIVKNAGQQYSQAAYETLSILLIVVVNKSGNDLQISKLLGDLCLSFPQLETLLAIYPSSKLEIGVASVYREIILFAREAATYFARFSVRLWSAVGKPPSIGISVTTETIKGLLVEVNAEAMILLHVRNKEILSNTTEIDGKMKRLLQDNEKLRHTSTDSNVRISELQEANEVLSCVVTESNLRIQQLQEENKKLAKNVALVRENSEVKLKQDDDENLATFRNEFNIRTECPEIDLEKCAQGIRGAFPNENTSRRKRCTRYEQMTSELLESHVPYKRWDASLDSALLFLYGSTSNESRMDISATTYSWLSPAVSYVAQNARQKPRTLLAYYCCHPHARAEKINTSTVFLSLIYQLIASRTSILRNNRTKFERFASIFAHENRVDEQVDGKAARKKDEKTTITESVSFLREVLLELGKCGDVENIYIALDRVDQCSALTSRIMDQLANLVLGSEFRLKIAVTCDTSFSNNWELDNLSDQARERVFVEDSPWRQNLKQIMM